MKNTFLIIFALFINSVLFAQPEITLKTIAEKIINYQDYSSHCIYTFSFVDGKTMTAEADMIIQKNIKDTLNGFSYYFKTNEKYKNVLGDFAMYFNGFYYYSRKGEIERISFLEDSEKFKGRYLSYGYAGPIHKSHVLYDKTPYQIGDIIINTLKNTNVKLTQKSDTIILGNTCLQFNLDVPNKYGGKDEYNLAFDKKELYPVICRKEFYGKGRKAKSQFTLVHFTNTVINQNLSLSYFNEENILGKNWKTKYTPPNTKRPNDLIGKQAPEWSLPVFGKEEKLSSDSLKGKYALVEFTATWCGYCNEAVKFMNTVEETFKEKENIEIVSIFSSHYDNKESISKFIERNNPRSTILYLAKNVEKEYYIDGYPGFFIIAPDGKILKSYAGYSPTFNEEILSTLKDLSGEE